MSNDFSGIVLAGGENSRMGEDKAFMLFSGKPLIEHTLSEISQLFKKILVITNRPFNYREYNIKVQRDILPKRGSLGGIYTGLVVSGSEYNFIIACDMPFLNQGLIKYMVSQCRDYDVVVPEFEGRLQPLFAIYSSKCIDSIEEQFFQKNFRIVDIFSHVRAKVISEETVRKFDKDGQCFININTPQDYQRFKDRL